MKCWSVESYWENLSNTPSKILSIKQGLKKYHLGRTQLICHESVEVPGSKGSRLSLDFPQDRRRNQPVGESFVCNLGYRMYEINVVFTSNECLPTAGPALWHHS